VLILLAGVVAVEAADSSSSWSPTQKVRPPGPADKGCFSNTNRYTDCGNGTVTDGVTGLIWLKDANCFGQADWKSASDLAAALAEGQCGLTDNSSAGQWRLPTPEEWRDITADHQDYSMLRTGCVPSIANDAGTGCWATGPSSFSGVLTAFYWSSATDPGFPTVAWNANLFSGNVVREGKTSVGVWVWPVRGGPSR
jgi:hypothetical protein